MKPEARISKHERNRPDTKDNYKKLDTPGWTVEMVRQALFTLTKAWREVVRELTDSYRPELHYMRGPGPKSAANQGRL